MIRPLLSLERLSFSEKEGKVSYHIINYLKLIFVASKPPPPRIAYQEVLMAPEAPAEYFLPGVGGENLFLALHGVFGTKPGPSQNVIQGIP